MQRYRTIDVIGQPQLAYDHIAVLKGDVNKFRCNTFRAFKTQNKALPAFPRHQQGGRFRGLRQYLCTLKAQIAHPASIAQGQVQSARKKSPFPVHRERSVATAVLCQKLPRA